MNLRSVKTIVLGGMALLVATLPSLAQIPIEPIRLTTATRFNCGPHLETYIGFAEKVIEKYRSLNQ